MPGLPAVTVERDVTCRARDGVALRGDVYRPTVDASHPVLLMREPYDKNTAQSGSGYRHPSWWASQGWVVVVQDCRGRFRSEGDFYPFRNEARDGYDTIEWAARLPGSDGRVGDVRLLLSRRHPAPRRQPSARRASWRSAPA